MSPPTGPPGRLPLAARPCRTCWSRPSRADVVSARGLELSLDRRADAARRDPRRHRRARPPGPPRRGVRRGGRAGRFGPSGAARGDAQRRAARRPSTSSTRSSSCGSGPEMDDARRGAGGRSTTRTPPPRPTRRAPTSPTPASRARTTCWSRPRDPDVAEVRSYRIVDGVVTEEPVDLVPAAQPWT